jgi:hypothetical protein
MYKLTVQYLHIVVTTVMTTVQFGKSTQYVSDFALFRVK